MPARPLNRICYVEDDPDIQRIVRMSLERIGKLGALGDEAEHRARESPAGPRLPVGRPAQG